MTCPKCHSEFETTGNACPGCGISLLRNISGVLKTSAVMIAAGGEQGFYNSVRDVPEPLRTQLLETTAGRNSGTIVIADSAGKEQLTQALARRETAGDGSLGTSSVADERETAVPHRFPRGKWLAWGGMILVLVLAAVISAFFYLHW